VVTERPNHTAQGYRRIRCRQCGNHVNGRNGSLLNRTQYPSDVIALVVLWRLRSRLALRDLPEIFAVRGIVFSHEMVRDWEAKLTPVLAEDRVAKWSTLKSWGTRLAKRIGARKATVAVARKLAGILHRMWKDGSEFRWSAQDAKAA